jgi:SAM-dependent methyltransferase
MYFDHRHDVYMMGLDCCAGMLDLCAERGCEVCPVCCGHVRCPWPWIMFVLSLKVVRGDVLSLPVRDRGVDAVICVSVLHHLATEHRRHAAAVEIVRVLRAGGAALVHVWSFEQDAATRRCFDRQDVLVPWTLQRRNLTADDATILDAGGVIDVDRGVVVLQR